MEESLFIEYVKKYFPKLVLRFTSELNDSKIAPTYLHTQYLPQLFSVTGQWDTISEQNQLVSADYVAMDSSLPLKKRGGTSATGGKIPKTGIEMQLNETELTNLQTTIAVGADEAQIVRSLFADTQKVIAGQYERNEATFLEGLSTGEALITDDNVGADIAVKYGYFAENQFGVGTVWSNASGADPFADWAKVQDKASGDGNAPAVLFMDDFALKNLVATDAFKDQFAFTNGISGNTRVVPTNEDALRLVGNVLGVTPVLVKRSVRFQKNGVNTNKKPWAEGRLVFAPAGALGSLVYARLAEEGAPVAGVTYQKAANYILASKFRTNRPSLAEFTTSQARVLPVITNVDQIYTIDTKVVQA